MWRGYYGKEPFDLRLTFLRLLRRLPFVAAVTLLGTLVFGGGYYVKNVLLQGDRTYAATSVYHVEYAVENQQDIANVYINEVSWNTYMQSEMFLDAVEGHLERSGGDTALVSGRELAAMIRAQVLSDLRMPSTVITSDSPEKSVEIARAVEAAMTGELADSIGEIASIALVDPGSEAEEVVRDVRPGRAFALSAVLSCFFAMVLLLLKETGDDSIWLPGSVWKRYGIKCAGTIESRELAENLHYFFPGEKSQGQSREETSGKGIAVCAVQEEVDEAEVLERLKAVCPDIVDKRWFTVPSPLREPRTARQLREAEGILLAVKAGSHAGRAFERVLEYLGQQDCQVTPAILWQADERLLRSYDFGKRAGGRQQNVERGI